MKKLVAKYEQGKLKGNITGMQKFLRKINSQGLKLNTIILYLKTFRVFSEWCKKPIEDLTDDDLYDFTEYLKGHTYLKGGRKRHYSKDTIKTFKTFMKSFFNYLGRKDLCDALKDHKKSVTIKYPGRKGLLEVEDLRQMLDFATSARDKAILMVLFEAGPRKSELLSSLVQDVKFNDHGCKLTFSERNESDALKTGERTVQLVHATPYLRAWLNVHPCKLSKGPIKDCFENYGKIQRDSECGLRLYYLIFIAGMASVFFILLISLIVSPCLFNQIQFYPCLETLRAKNNITYEYLLLVVISFLLFLSSFIPFFLSVKLKNYVLIKDDEVIHKYTKVKQIYSTIVIYSLVLFFSSFNVMFSFNKFFNIIITCAIFLFSISVYFSTLNIRDYTQRVKESVNNGYSRNFPYLEISTLGGKDVYGKLENVFNSESIVLNNNGEYTTILWSSISTLKEQSRNDFDVQKKLTDFFKDFD